MILYMTFFLFPLCPVTGDIKVTRSGVRSISRLDVGMIFFVELVNEGKQQITADSRMIGCCEILTIDDIECEHIQLVGGEVGPLLFKEEKNVTLIWPTLYLHDRRGECEVVIFCRNNNDVEEIREKISFDTKVSKKIPKILEGYYERHNVKKCSSIDLDTLDFCHPVNCQIKYNGKRNYFNRKLQRCQPVPVCLADSTKELPDMVYDPVGNTCRNPENAVTPEELQRLNEGAMQIAWRSEPSTKIPNVLCYHGHKEKHTNLCICEKGWTSQPLGNLEPVDEYIRMCDVLVLPYPGLGNSSIHILFIIMAVVLSVLIILFYCTMIVFTQVLPRKAMVERYQQTRTSSYSNSSSKNLAYCSTATISKRKYNSGSNITYSKLSNPSTQSVTTKSK